MPRLPSSAAIVLYQQCPDWKAFEQLSSSDEKKKLRNVIHADSCRKQQPPADVYAYKREKALQHASRLVITAVDNDETDIVDVGTSLSAEAKVDGEERECPSSSAFVAISDVSIPLPMDIESRVMRLERVLCSMGHLGVTTPCVRVEQQATQAKFVQPVGTFKPAVTGFRGRAVVRNDSFLVVAGVMCTASRVEWEEQCHHSCSLVDCLLLWTNQSYAAVEHFDSLRSTYMGGALSLQPQDEVRIWQQMYDNSTDVFLVVEGCNNRRQRQHRYECLHHPHRLPRDRETEIPVVYIDKEHGAYLLSGPGLVEKLFHELRQQASGTSNTDPVLLVVASSSATSSDVVDASTASIAAGHHNQDSMIDLTVEPIHRGVPPRLPVPSKRKNIDTTGATVSGKRACPHPLVLDRARLQVCCNAFFERLRVEQVSILPIAHDDGRCLLTAALVALGKIPHANVDAGHVLDQCRQQLVRRMEQWTEPMWIKHVPASLRQRHWGADPQHKSSFLTYHDLLKSGGSGLDHCVLYLASIEYEVDIRVVTATFACSMSNDAPTAAQASPSFTVECIRTQRAGHARHIVLLHRRLNDGKIADDRYEVVQHHSTTVLNNEQHDVFLRRLKQLPAAAALAAIADPEVDVPELDMGGYEKAPALLGKGTFARVYRVTSKNPCVHPRWHALKIASETDAKHAITTVQREARFLQTLAGLRGVPRLLQVVSQRAFSVEYCVGGSLESVLKRTRRLPLAVCMEVFRQLLCTIQHAHAAGLLHRDIKPANILLRHKLTDISTIHEVDVVLADWGLAIAISDRQGNSVVGTPMYLPPEVLSGEQSFDTTCDVWAAGCVLAQLLRDGGAPLFNGKFMSDWQARLKKRLTVDIPRNDIRELLHAVLSSKRSERPDASRVLQMLPSS